MFERVITVVTLGAMIALLLLFQSSNPSTIGPGGIFAAFFLMYVIFVGIFTWVVRFGSIVRQHLSPLIGKKYIPGTEPMLHSYYYGSVIAIAPLMAIGMSSVGSIGVYEILLITLFELVAIFYVKKRLR